MSLPNSCALQTVNCQDLFVWFKCQTLSRLCPCLLYACRFAFACLFLLVFTFTYQSGIMPVFEEARTMLYVTSHNMITMAMSIFKTWKDPRYRPITRGQYRGKSVRFNLAFISTFLCLFIGKFFVYGWQPFLYYNIARHMHVPSSNSASNVDATVIIPREKQTGIKEQFFTSSPVYSMFSKISLDKKVLVFAVIFVS